MGAAIRFGGFTDPLDGAFFKGAGAGACGSEGIGMPPINRHEVSDAKAVDPFFKRQASFVVLPST
ncbi:MAG: hypothetical protein HWE12_13800 [Oceanospirillaceae bacterium]|nr:hypothetical protein [Oceanospirillaceae bacterium]